MRYRFIVSCSAAIAACSSPEPPPAPEAQLLLDSVLALARRHSVWRDTVSWRAVARAARRELAGAKTRDDAYPAIEIVTQSLGDHHSFALPPDRVEILQGAAASVPARGPAEGVQGQLLGEHRVALLHVPAHTREDIPGNRVYAAALRASIERLARPRPCGWIVDLRQNTGGNMWPMLAGLRPLFGTDTLGAFVGPDSSWRWTAEGPEESNSRTYMKELRGDALDLSSATVAVLIGPSTGSSGEAVALALRGRPNTRSFGAPTRGVAAANARFRLPDGGWLILTTAVMKDRDGRGDGGPIQPEVKARTTEPRAAVDSAVSWITSGCRARKR